MRGLCADRRYLGAPARVPDLRSRGLLRLFENRHATRHFHSSKHPIMRSVEPGDTWGWCYVDGAMAQLD